MSKRGLNEHDKWDRERGCIYTTATMQNGEHFRSLLCLNSVSPPLMTITPHFLWMLIHQLIFIYHSSSSSIHIQCNALSCCLVYLNIWLLIQILKKKINRMLFGCICSPLRTCILIC